ncbi:TetR/AcrR family transcriptional regulator [Micromonospora sp. M12]
MPQRGRPRGFDADEALERAVEVFWRQGYEGASVSDLTEAMGINKPSLYAAYGGKEELFRKAVARYAERTWSTRGTLSRNRPRTRWSPPCCARTCSP